LGNSVLNILLCNNLQPSVRLHVRRNVIFGQEGTAKTIERAASLPLLDEVRVPLELWRKERGNPSDG